MNASPYRMIAPVPAEEAYAVAPDGRALPLTSTSVRAEASGGIARVVVEQVFENPYAETLHVTYKMPLSADGAVSGYEFVIGARTVKGRVEPKAKARAQFEEAIASGRSAALLEQKRADMFLQEIGNIPAGQSITARITVDQKLAWLPEGEWELRFPLAIGPRYVNNAKDAAEVGFKVLPASEITSAVSIEIDVRDELTPGRNVDSPSHPVSARGDTTVVLTATKLDRDIVARWAVAKPEVGLTLMAARPARDLAAYGLLTIVPPKGKRQTVARDLIVLIDTSGSMGGSPLEQAKKTIAMLIDSLTEHDRLELIEFSSSPTRWRKAPLNATSQTKRDAKKWVSNLDAGGATEMYSAIVEALSALRPEAQRQVVLVTDGYIGGEQQIVKLLHERLPDSCRLHVVGVGSAVNRSLATALSRAGRGAEVIVDLDQDVERPTRRLLDRTADPILTNVTVEGAAVLEVAPQHVPDVFANAPIVCALKLDPEGGEVVVRGYTAHGLFERRIIAPVIDPGQGSQAIPALYAREHVADLEMKWTIGSETQLIDRTIEKTGVLFQIATRMTSWVAIDEVRVVDPSSGTRKVEQPQALPYGTSMQSFGLSGGGADDDEDMMTSVGMPMPMSMATRAGSIGPAGMAFLGGFGAPPPPQQAQMQGGAPPGAPPVVQPAPMPMSLSSAPRREDLKEKAAYGSSMLPMSYPEPAKRQRSRLALFLIALLVALVVFAVWFFLIRR